MIPRYSRKILKEIWEDNNKFQIWLDLEILACEAMEKLDQIPKGTSNRIKKKAKFKVKEIEKIEEKTKHDIIAFLTNVAKYVGAESRYIHKGLTSSDILDTSFSIQLNQSSNIILGGLEKLSKSLLSIAKKHKYTLCIGRSHGIHAETTTFGLKILGYLAENNRNINRLKNSIKQIQTIQMSGPVGTYSNIDTRNNYEYKIGHFKNSINPKIDTFKEFNEYIKTNKDQFQNKKVAIYCTGGIRCEKAGPLMERYGIDTYQLKGGILKYFEQTNSKLWNGECFVFDYRVSLTKELSKGISKLCYGCNTPLTIKETKSPKYEKGFTCPVCFDNMTEKKRRSLKDKREHWKKVF